MTSTESVVYEMMWLAGLMAMLLVTRVVETPAKGDSFTSPAIVSLATLARALALSEEPEETHLVNWKILAAGSCIVLLLIAYFMPRRQAQLRVNTACMVFGLLFLAVLTDHAQRRQALDGSSSPAFEWGAAPSLAVVTFGLARSLYLARGALGMVLVHTAYVVLLVLLELWLSGNIAKVVSHQALGWASSLALYTALYAPKSCLRRRTRPEAAEQ
jgi:hypothetical protein